MSPQTVTRRFPRSSPYWPVVTHPLLRRVLPGLAVSALGDGMALVAVTWLALQLAPAGQQGTWVAIAVAASTLPSAAGALVFGRFLRGRNGAQLAGWDAILRAGALAAIPVTYALGALSISLYVTLLAVSSLLHAWGSAGRYTLIAELLPERHHLPANAVLTTITELATIAGPPLAGILIGWSNAAAVIAIDAATFAVLAATYRLALPRVGRADPVADGASRAAGFAVIRHDRTLRGLLALTFAFFFLFGPVLVALPIHITQDLHGSATLLGAYYTAFGIGAVIGGLAAGYLRRWSLWPTVIGIVLGFGTAMLPLGLAAPTGIALTSFAIAGLTWGPYMSTTLALFQRTTTAALLPQVLAANAAVTVLSTPLGTMLGGPLVAALGARQTLLLSATTTLTLGLIAAATTTLHRRRKTDRTDHHSRR
jgi:DHA3 family macrolide efflux protein-like MFS transporter